MPHSRETSRQIAMEAAKDGREVVRQRRGLSHETMCRILRRAREGTTLTQEKRMPNILVFDIETAPMKSWHWGVHKVYIDPVQVDKWGHVLCWTAKWLDSPTVLFDSVKGEEENDKRCCLELWELCNKADIIVGHNGKAFDLATMKTRWLYHRIPPPAPSKMVDTLRIARKVFNFPSNKLDGIARYLGLGKKIDHEGFQLWLDCMADVPVAWRKMEEYNIEDTLLLEDIYLQIRPWDNRHPNVALYYGDRSERCVCCGSKNLTTLVQGATTSVSVFPASRCVQCSKIVRSGKRDAPSGDIFRNVI